MSVAPLSGIVKRAWIPLIVLVVLAVSGLVVTRLHRQFASQNLNANAGAGIEIVQFNPKIMIYDVYGSGTAQISYFDPDANVHLVSVPLPWSITLSTTLPAVSGSLTAQTTLSSTRKEPDLRAELSSRL